MTLDSFFFPSKKSDLSIDNSKKLSNSTSFHTSNLPWIEKYRPNKLEELVAQESVIKTLEKFIENRQLPHLLFYGPPGTGKTTTALACARKLYGSEDCMKSMVLELNASDDRGIDVVREQIKTFAATKKMFYSNENFDPSKEKSTVDFKLIILDEADSMTSAAQAALRRVIERYVSNVRFCLICNYVNGIIPALQSRCTKFRFSPLPDESIKEMVTKICSLEENQRNFLTTSSMPSNDSCDGCDSSLPKFTIDSSAIDAVVSIAKGDMRRALNTLQSAVASLEGQKITAGLIFQLMNVPSNVEVERIFAWLCNENFDESFHSFSTLMTRNAYSLSDVISGLFNFMLNLKFESKQRIFLMQKMAFIEHALNKGSSEKIQMAALVSAFQLSKSLS